MPKKEKLAEEEKTNGKTNIGYGRRKKHGGIIGALFLIFFGILLLLNNLGIVDWTIWGEFWKFWPLILVLIGIEMILGKSRAAYIIFIVLVFLVLTYIMVYFLSLSGVILPLMPHNLYMPPMMR